MDRVRAVLAITLALPVMDLNLAIVSAARPPVLITELTILSIRSAGVMTDFMMTAVLPALRVISPVKLVQQVDSTLVRLVMQVPHIAL